MKFRHSKKVNTPQPFLYCAVNRIDYYFTTGCQRKYWGANNFMVFNISQRAKSISPFLAMEYAEKASELEKSGRDVIRFNIGEPDFGAPLAVNEALVSASSQHTFAYTSALGLPALRHEIAQFYSLYHKVDINADRIIITAGASAALLLLSAALVNPNDKVIICDPSYPCNRQFISHYGGKVVLLPTSADDRFQLTRKSIAEAWTNDCKGVLLASPSNPTGTGIRPDELKAISQFCQQQSAWRIIDEIYLNLQLGDSPTLDSVLTFDDSAIVVNSFSKFFGMTGWRLGWCVVPENMVSTIEKLAQNLFICPSTPAQYAALACFSEQALAECEQRRTTLKKRLHLVLDAIEHSPLSVDVLPDGAFYCFVNISKTGLNAIDFCNQLLDVEAVALTPGNDFGIYNADKYVRLSFATDETQLIEGLDRIQRFANMLVN